MSTRAFSLRALLLAAVCVPCSTLPALAAEIFVAPDGSGQYPTLQAALDAAQEGDTLLLGDGRFEGPGNHGLTIWRAISIRPAQGGPSSCIIDCEGDYLSGSNGGITRYEELGFRGSALSAQRFAEGHPGQP